MSATPMTTGDCLKGSICNWTRETKACIQKTRKTDGDTQISNHRAWGCPALALESKIQTDFEGLPKLNPRARSGNAVLVFNPSTGHVSIETRSCDASRA